MFDIHTVLHTDDTMSVSLYKDTAQDNNVGLSIRANDCSLRLLVKDDKYNLIIADASKEQEYSYVLDPTDYRAVIGTIINNTLASMRGAISVGALTKETVRNAFTQAYVEEFNGTKESANIAFPWINLLYDDGNVSVPSILELYKLFSTEYSPLCVDAFSNFISLTTIAGVLRKIDTIVPDIGDPNNKCPFIIARLLSH